MTPKTNVKASAGSAVTRPVAMPLTRVCDSIVLVLSAQIELANTFVARDFVRGTCMTHLPGDQNDGLARDLESCGRILLDEQNAETGGADLLNGRDDLLNITG